MSDALSIIKMKMMLPRPRSYTDWSVPLDEHGNELGSCEEEGSYNFYLEWLANYLFKTVIPVPESQQATLTEYRVKGAGYAVLDLSDCLGYSIFDTEVIEERSARGEPFSELQSDELDMWNDLSEDEQEDWDREDFFTNEEEYMRLGTEFQDVQKVPSHIQHVDIPYRPILAALFKEVSDFNERYEHLNYFYRNFNDCASK